MKHGRFWRNKITILSMALAIIISLSGKVTGNNFNNFNDALSALIGFSSIATAVLMAALAFLPNYSKGILGKFSTDKKFLDRVLITVFLYFWISVVSVLILFLVPEKSDSYFSSFLVSIDLSMFVGAIEESMYITWFLLTGVD